MWSGQTLPKAVPERTQTFAFVQQLLGELRAGHASATDVWEGVERARWHAASDARNLVEPTHDQITPSAELGGHRIDRVLRPVERFGCGDLLEGARAGHAVDDQLAVRVDEAGRHDRIAHAPAGHRVGLGEAVEDDRALGHVRQAADRVVLALVDQPAVNLVGHDHDVVLARDVSDGFQVGLGENAAGGVVGRVEDDQLCARRDQRAQLVRVKSEILVFAEAQRRRAFHRRSASSTHRSGSQGRGR